MTRPALILLTLTLLLGAAAAAAIVTHRPALALMLGSLAMASAIGAYGIGANHWTCGSRE